MNKRLIFNPYIYIYTPETYRQLSCIQAGTPLDKRLSLSPESTHRNRKMSAVGREVSLVAATKVSDVAGAGVVGEVRSGGAVAAAGRADARDTR